MNLAPKKVNWDLKRDIAKKMEQRDIQTQRFVPQFRFCLITARAIVHLIQQKITQQRAERGSSDEE